MQEETKKSKFLVIIFWLATIGCFIFGYYNTHLGLRTFRAFDSSGYGSWFLAAIPLVMVVGGYIASVQGNKKMLALYLTGEIIFFVFNLTYLYPTYLGRTLVHEEARELKDSVNVYQNTLDKIAGVSDPRIQRLKNIQTNLLTEIKDRQGFGDSACRQLLDFNRVAGTSYTCDRRIGRPEEWESIHRRWEANTNDGIKQFLIKLKPKDKYAAKLVNAKYKMDSISANYSDKLVTILGDNSDVSIEHKDVMNNPQINLLDTLTGKLDSIAINVNSVDSGLFNLIVTGKETIAFPKTKKLGTFEHTMISCSERIGKLDTWGILIVCFFFDLLGPFLFYFYLRNEDAEFTSRGGDEVWDRPWWKKLFRIQ